MTLLDFFVIIGTVASAISGALMGVRKHLDFFGIIVLGITTALGGGIIRDISLGITPPKALLDPKLILFSVAATGLVMSFPKKFTREAEKIAIFDAIGLAAYTAVGANIALHQATTSTFLVVAIGVITGVGGGIIRDMFVQEIPLVFKKEIYATASILGALSLILAQWLLGGIAPLYIAFFVTLALRLGSIYLDLHLPVIREQKQFLPK